MYASENQADLKNVEEEGGRPISTIYISHKGLSQLVTMVTFFHCIYCFREQTTPPPPPKKKGPMASLEFFK